MSLEAFLASVRSIGAEPCANGFSWRDTAVLASSGRGARIELLVLHGACDATSVERALRSNPHAGWSFVVAQGRLWRRVVLSPVSWALGGGLAATLDALVLGEVTTPDQYRAERLFAVHPDKLVSTTTRSAIAVWLLAQDRAHWDGFRHLWAGPSPWDAALAGRGDLRARAMRESQLLSVLTECPAACCELVELWIGDAAKSTADPIEKGENPS